MVKKRLLVLGGISQVCSIVEQARAMGVYVVVTDYLPDSPAKRIADASFNVSITDVKGLVKLCREQDIDGVMNYCIDPGQKPYEELCRVMGYPCYGTFDQFAVLTNKDVFKDYCLAHGVGVVQSYNVSPDMTLEDISQIDFPVMIKPADGRGSKGLVKCDVSRELPLAINHALKYSPRRKVICERIINKPEVAVKYFVIDGDIALTSMSDIYTSYTDGKRNYIWSQTFPSKHYNLLLRDTDSRLRLLIKSLGIQNGPLSFSGFVDDEVFRFIDPSFRMGGAQDWRIVDAICGVDISTLLTQFALTGSMGDNDIIPKLDNAFSGAHSAMLYFLCKPGKIGTMLGIEDSGNDPAVIGFHVTHKSGDEIIDTGTADHVIARFLVVCKSKETLIQSLKRIQMQVKVLDNFGNNMLLPNFDTELLL